MIKDDMEFYNVEEMIDMPDGSMALSRIPLTVSTQLNQAARLHRSLNTCGCEIRFNLVDEEVTVVLRRDKEADVPFGIAEVFFGSYQAPYGSTVKTISQEATAITIKKKDMEIINQFDSEEKERFDSSLVRIVLPYDNKTFFVEKTGSTSPPVHEQVPAKRYLAYGSSITHGGDAVRPSGTYAMCLADLLDRDLINLGFAGSAHMEEAIAAYIVARQDWDIATIEMGINVINQWSAKKFKISVQRFIEILAEDTEERRIYITDLYTCRHDISNRSLINEYREIVKQAVQRTEHANITYINGADLLRFKELSADLVHPSAKGQEALAHRWHQVIHNQK